MQGQAGGHNHRPRGTGPQGLQDPRQRAQGRVPGQQDREPGPQDRRQRTAGPEAKGRRACRTRGKGRRAGCQDNRTGSQGQKGATSTAA